MEQAVFRPVVRAAVRTVNQRFIWRIHHPDEISSAIHAARIAADRKVDVAREMRRILSA